MLLWGFVEEAGALHCLIAWPHLGNYSFFCSKKQKKASLGELFSNPICQIKQDTKAGEPLRPKDTMSNNETTELVKALRQGDEQAFSSLVKLYQHKIYNLALNYVKQPEEAKDLTQDIFVTVYRSFAKLRDDTKFSAWLFQVAVNHCRNRYKKLKNRGYFSSRSIDDPDSTLHLSSGEHPEKELERDNVINIVRSEIASMPQAEKEILLLRDIQELSYDEISVILNVPLGTVKSKLNRARSALKDRLKKVL